MAKIDTARHDPNRSQQTVWPSGEQVKITALVANPKNPRTHSRQQIRKIAASIEQFGFVKPVLIDATNDVIAGHGRVTTVQNLGWETVPTLRIEHLSDADMRAYILVDNRLAEDAGWDEDILAIELQGLIDLDVSIELTGFELAEVDRIIEGQWRAVSTETNIADDPCRSTKMPLG